MLCEVNDGRKNIIKLTDLKPFYEKLKFQPTFKLETIRNRNPTQKTS